ncbi:hypothetical protein V8F20_007293 [Naviculisporaceae sp. PSN 640]
MTVIGPKHLNLPIASHPATATTARRLGAVRPGAGLILPYKHSVMGAVMPGAGLILPYKHRVMRHGNADKPDKQMIHILWEFQIVQELERSHVEPVFTHFFNQACGFLQLPDFRSRVDQLPPDFATQDLQTLRDGTSHDSPMISRPLQRHKQSLSKAMADLELWHRYCENHPESALLLRQSVAELRISSDGDVSPLEANLLDNTSFSQKLVGVATPVSVQKHNAEAKKSGAKNKIPETNPAKVIKIPDGVSPLTLVHEQIPQDKLEAEDRVKHNQKKKLVSSVFGSSSEALCQKLPCTAPLQSSPPELSARALRHSTSPNLPEALPVL